MAAKDTLIESLEAAYITRDQTSSPATAVLATAATAGDTTITLDDASDFADGMPIRIGTEFNWVDGTPTSLDVVTLGRPLQADHDDAEDVVEQVVYDPGPPSGDGTSVTFSGQSVSIPVATQRLPFAKLNGAKTGRITWAIPNFTPSLFCFAAGMALSRITGAGTSTSPLHLSFDGAEFAEETNQTYIAIANLFGGTQMAVEFWNASAILDNLSAALSRGQAVTVPITAAASSAGGIFETNAYGFTPDTTYRASAGKVWDALTEVGVFADTATTTTLNGNVSAGATSITLTSGASFSDGDWVKADGAGGVEYLWLGNKSTNTFTLRGKTHRALGTGITITKVTLTKFAAVAAAGVTFGASVQTQDIPDATQAYPIATRLGEATVTFGFGITAFTLDNLAQALNIPAADIVSGRMPWGTNVGSGSGIEGAYLKGTTKDGSTVYVVAAGCDIDLANVASKWTNTGDAAQLPFSLQPTSYAALLQHS